MIKAQDTIRMRQQKNKKKRQVKKNVSLLRDKKIKRVKKKRWRKSNRTTRGEKTQASVAAAENKIESILASDKKSALCPPRNSYPLRSPSPDWKWEQVVWQDECNLSQMQQILFSMTSYDIKMLYCYSNGRCFMCASHITISSPMERPLMRLIPINPSLGYRVENLLIACVECYNSLFGSCYTSPLDEVIARDQESDLESGSDRDCFSKIEDDEEEEEEGEGEGEYGYCSSVCEDSSTLCFSCRYYWDIDVIKMTNQYIR